MSRKCFALLAMYNGKTTFLLKVLNIHIRGLHIIIPLFSDTQQMFFITLLTGMSEKPGVYLLHSLCPCNRWTPITRITNLLTNRLPNMYLPFQQVSFFFWPIFFFFRFDCNSVIMKWKMNSWSNAQVTRKVKDSCLLFLNIEHLIGGGVKELNVQIILIFKYHTLLNTLNFIFWSQLEEDAQSQKVPVNIVCFLQRWTFFIYF